MTDSVLDSELDRRLDAAPVVPMISVAICSYNGASRIGTALAALIGQVHTAPFEVIVVDDGSTDETANIAAREGATVIRLDRNLGRGRGLKAAVQVARGAILAMADDDCVPPPFWVQQLADAWTQAPESVTVIGGTVTPLATDTFNRRYIEFRRPLAAQELGDDPYPGVVARLRRTLVPPPDKSGRRAVSYMAGANMSLRLSAVRQVGGFDTSIHFGGEEELLCRNLRDVFGSDTVQLVPDIEMLHDFRPHLGDSLRRSRAYGRAHAKIWVKSGGIPTLPPIPLLVAALLTPVFAWRPRLATLALALLPPVLYRGWLARCWETATLEPILYPYVHFLDDLAGDIGFVEGLQTSAET